MDYHLISEWSRDGGDNGRTLRLRRVLIVEILYACNITTKQDRVEILYDIFYPGPA
jgi:hypothetical protein